MIVFLNVGFFKKNLSEIVVKKYVDLVSKIPGFYRNNGCLFNQKSGNFKNWFPKASFQKNIFSKIIFLDYKIVNSKNCALFMNNVGFFKEFFFQKNLSEIVV